MLIVSGKADHMHTLLKQVCKVVKASGSIPILECCIIDENGITGTNLQDSVFVDWQGLSVTGQGIIAVRPHELIRVFGAKPKSREKKVSTEYRRVTAAYTPPCESFKVCQEAAEDRADLRKARENYQDACTRYEQELTAFKKWGGRRNLLGDFVAPKKSAKAMPENQMALFASDELPLAPIKVPVAPHHDAHKRAIASLTGRMAAQVKRCRDMGCRHEEITPTTAYTRAGKPIGNVNLTRPKQPKRQDYLYGLKGLDFTLEIAPLEYVEVKTENAPEVDGEKVTEIVKTPTPRL